MKKYAHVYIHVVPETALRLSKLIRRQMTTILTSKHYIEMSRRKKLNEHAIAKNTIYSMETTWRETKNNNRTVITQNGIC